MNFQNNMHINSNSNSNGNNNNSKNNKNHILNSNEVSENPNDTNNIDLELNRNQISDFQQHKKNISELPINYSNFDTYHNDSFREKSTNSRIHLEHSEKKPRYKGEYNNLPKSKTKIVLSKDKAIPSNFSEGIYYNPNIHNNSNNNINDTRQKLLNLSNKKKQHKEDLCEDTLNSNNYNPNQNKCQNMGNLNFNNLSINAKNLNFPNSQNNSTNANSNNINTRNSANNNTKNKAIYSATTVNQGLEDREKLDKFIIANNNMKKNFSNNNFNVVNNNGYSNGNSMSSSNINNPNTMRFSGNTARSGISFSNNLNNIYASNLNKNELMKNNHLIDLIKENSSESAKLVGNTDSNINNNIDYNKLSKSNSIINSKANNILSDDNNYNNFQSHLFSEEKVTNSANQHFKNALFPNEGDVNYIENDSFDDKIYDNKKDNFYLAVEKSQTHLNNNENNSSNIINNRNRNNMNNTNNINNDNLLNENTRNETSSLSRKNFKLNTKVAEEEMEKSRASGSFYVAKTDSQHNKDKNNQFLFDDTHHKNNHNNYNYNNNSLSTSNKQIFNKISTAGVYSNRHRDSISNEIQYNSNNNNNNINNSNRSSNNRIEMKNNTFARDNNSAYKDKEENEHYFFNNYNNNNNSAKDNINKDVTNKELLRMLDIMKSYLKIEQKQFNDKKNDFKQKTLQKDIEIAKLKVKQIFILYLFLKRQKIKA